MKHLANGKAVVSKGNKKQSLLIIIIIIIILVMMVIMNNLFWLTITLQLDGNLGRGVLPGNLGGGVQPTTGNPNPISDPTQNSIPYFRPDPYPISFA